MMRHFLVAGILALFSTPGLAGPSVVEWDSSPATPPGGVSYVTFVACGHCTSVAETAPVEKAAVSRPFSAELREVDGSTRVFRTEAMMGGSPVTTVASTEVAYGERFGDDATLLAEPEGEPVTVPAFRQGAEAVVEPVPGVGEMSSSAIEPQPAIDREARTSAVREADGEAQSGEAGEVVAVDQADAGGLHIESFDLRLN